MTSAPGDLPDWTRGYLLIGQDSSGDPVVILVDSDGQLQMLLRGQDSSGDPQVVKVDVDGQIYTVLRGADNVDVAVDSDGFLTAVLKGIRDGTLTTIAVDAAGRIEAYAVDAEDQWGKKLLTGNSELAGRLGSPITYDWRGQTLAYNTFANGMGNLYTTLGGTGSEASVSPDYSLLGGYSLKMLGGSDGTELIKVQGIVGTNPTDRVGLTVAWAGFYTFDYVTFGLLVKKGTDRYVARLKYDPGSYWFGYQDSDGAWQQLGTVYLTNYPYAFNFLKLVIDVDSGIYLRALLNDTEYDLSAYALDTDLLGFSQAIEVEVEVHSVTGQNYGIYLDRFVVSVNEPL